MDFCRKLFCSGLWRTEHVDYSFRFFVSWGLAWAVCFWVLFSFFQLVLRDVVLMVVVSILVCSGIMVWSSCSWDYLRSAGICLVWGEHPWSLVASLFGHFVELLSIQLCCLLEICIWFWWAEHAVIGIHTERTVVPWRFAYVSPNLPSSLVAQEDLVPQMLQVDPKQN